ncbi:MAG: efflux RND transporter periplasmic adaptor subunit [Aliarcobacter sp.]|nr:efflux RND transporter periplasmic adaptor subunit [Aliarcobacter sp.]MBP6712670.1 efflux RND transporter periplasmic adaptor subunit [Aliarcobacter sp.]MBP7226241.1 efflux RND transporter periplasmic adaptor subunit [Aliarcobacter sp.]
MNTNLQNELNNYSNKSSNKKYYIFALILLLASGVAYYYFDKNSTNKKQQISYNTQKIKKGDLEVVVNATGNLKPTNSVEIGIEVSGTIKEIYVDFNDEVTVGQVLAVLDTRKLQSQVDSSSASLIIAKANQQESLVNVNNKKLNLDRTLKMYNQSNKKYPSKNEVDEVRFAYESSLASYDSAKAKVLQAQSNLKTDQQNLEKAVVKSSINGIVLNREVEVGQTLAATMSAPKLFTLAKDLTNMDLIVSIDEADVADIKKDLDVTFNVDAHPNEIFKGKIKQVRYNPVEVNGVITYETVVGVNNERLLLRPGMTASAKIITKESKDNILIPNTALRFKPLIQEPQAKQNSGMNNLVGARAPRKSGEPKNINKSEFKEVWILENKEPKKVRVKILESDGKFTSVESRDLKIDDEIIVSQRSGNE